MRKTFLIILATLVGGTARAAPITDLTTDFWKNDEQGWVVQAKPCDSGLCAFLVTYALVHQRMPGFVPIDGKNPDPARRNAPLCGLQLIGGFKPSAHKAGVWDSGWVYDPDSGSTYSGTITEVDASTVRLRGYVGLSLFGRTLVLHRVSEVSKPCALPPK